MTEEFKSPTDKLLPVIVQAVAEWERLNTPEVLKAKINKQLDSTATEIVAKLLGFDKNYDNKWSLDHCNGRNGDSAAGDFIRQHSAVAVNEWLRSAAMPTLSTTALTKIKKQMNDLYEEQFLRAISGHIKSRGMVDAQKLLNELCSSLDTDKYLKAIQLIKSEPCK